MPRASLIVRFAAAALLRGRHSRPSPRLGWMLVGYPCLSNGRPSALADPAIFNPGHTMDATLPPRRRPRPRATRSPTARSARGGVGPGYVCVRGYECAPARARRRGRERARARGRACGVRAHACACVRVRVCACVWRRCAGSTHQPAGCRAEEPSGSSSSAHPERSGPPNYGSTRPPPRPPRLGAGAAARGGSQGARGRVDVGAVVLAEPLAMRPRPGSEPGARAREELDHPRDPRRERGGRGRA